MAQFGSVKEYILESDCNKKDGRQTQHHKINVNKKNEYKMCNRIHTTKSEKIMKKLMQNINESMLQNA